jgi:aminopeptidase N
MKKTLIFLIILIFGNIIIAWSQSLDDQAQINKIQGLYNSKDYLGTIDAINKLLPKYPTINTLYFYRGLSRLKLNDYLNGRKDLLLAKAAGFRDEDNFIEANTSKEYMASELMKNLEYETKPDPKRNFKPSVEARDSLQGALTTLRSCFDVTFYNLTVKVKPDSKSIEGTNEIFFKASAGTKKIQIDLFPEFKVNSITWKNKSLSYTRKYGAIFVDFGEELKGDEIQKVTVDYNGSPKIAVRPPWDGGFVWDVENGRHYIGVACQHLGASSWWPCKDHLSDKPDSMRINLQIPEGYKGISNGNLRSEKNPGNGFTAFEWFVSYPINTYNVTLYVGDFVNFNEQYTNKSGTYPIDYYVLPKNLEKAKKYYSKTKDVIYVFEKLFGEYPFIKDGPAMVEAPFEGMEHQSAIAIGGYYGKGHKKEYWTKDYDYLLIHESGHEWWGNAVAIGDMADAWINEGFTTYAEYLFAEEKSGYPDYVETAAINQKYILNLWPIVGERNINENTFLGNDIYHKGAAMLNNLRCEINDDALFMKILSEYYGRYKFRITTSSDFIALVNEMTKADYGDFFRKFLYEAEPPILVCSYSIDGKKTLNFKYKWSNVGSNFKMPFCISINGKEYVRLEGTTADQTFTSENIKSFSLINEHSYKKELVPRNSFTYYWTLWSI